MMTRAEQLALDWLRLEQGDRPSFRLRYERLQEETGLSQKDAGYAVDSLRRAGFVEIESTPLPRKRHFCRVTDGSCS
jgi:DNA-binding MarR family transcriptional regulator